VHSWVLKQPNILAPLLDFTMVFKAEGLKEGVDDFKSEKQTDFQNKITHESFSINSISI